MFRRPLNSLTVLLTLLLLGTALHPSVMTAGQNPQNASAGKFTVWVFHKVNGDWEKQEDRTLVTGDMAAARKYVESVSAVEGWAATSNLPPYEEGPRSASAEAARALVGTRWTYFGSVEGCVFTFLEGNQVWATSYPQLGTWRVEGNRLTMEIQNPFCEGINVYTGTLESSSHDLHLQVVRSPYPKNVGREVILKRLPLPGFT